jgi:hypothetical protein
LTTGVDRFDLDRIRDVDCLWHHLRPPSFCWLSCNIHPDQADAHGKSDPPVRESDRCQIEHHPVWWAYIRKYGISSGEGASARALHAKSGDGACRDAIGHASDATFRYATR